MTKRLATQRMHCTVQSEWIRRRMLSCHSYHNERRKPPVIDWDKWDAALAGEVRSLVRQCREAYPGHADFT